MADVNKSNLNTHTGILPKDAFVVLVKTEWNAEIVDKLERGAIDKLKELGVKQIVTMTVPGAVEIPFAIKTYWAHTKRKKKNTSAGGRGRPDAFIALGCVIRGDTPHFDYVCQAVTQGVSHLNLLFPVPTIFGVLTVDNEEQAKERIGGVHGHKGEEAAVTAIKMIALNRSFKK